VPASEHDHALRPEVGVAGDHGHLEGEGLAHRRRVTIEIGRADEHAQSPHHGQRRVVRKLAGDEQAPIEVGARESRRPHEEQPESWIRASQAGGRLGDERKAVLGPDRRDGADHGGMRVQELLHRRRHRGGLGRAQAVEAREHHDLAGWNAQRGDGGARACVAADDDARQRERESHHPAHDRARVADPVRREARAQAQDRLAPVEQPGRRTGQRTQPAADVVAVRVEMKDPLAGGVPEELGREVEAMSRPEALRPALAAALADVEDAARVAMAAREQAVEHRHLHGQPSVGRRVVADDEHLVGVGAHGEPT